MKSIRTYLPGIILLVFLTIIFNGCSKNPVDDRTDNNELDHLQLQTVGEVGTGVFAIVTSTKKVTSLMQGPGGYLDPLTTGLDNFASVKSLAKKLLPAKMNQTTTDKSLARLNGAVSSERINFFANGTGTFFEDNRDGTHIEGSFDILEDDDRGSFTSNTTFRSGHNPISISESGSFTFNPIDSTTDGTLCKTLYYLNGSGETQTITVDQTLVTGNTVTHIKVQNSDSMGGEIATTAFDNREEATGWWLDGDEQYIKFNGTFSPDGSAVIDLEVYASQTAFDHGQPPIYTGHFFFKPDGYDNGQVFVNGKLYDVLLTPGGNQEIIG